jgi:lipoprotein-anchoring transpeptidase ErfK/SrfK
MVDRNSDSDHSDHLAAGRAARLMKPSRTRRLATDLKTRCPGGNPGRRAFLLLAARRTAGLFALAALVWTGGALPASARAHRHEQHSPPLTAESVNGARYEGRGGSRAQGAVLLKAAVLLDRLSFSSGAIDGKPGENFKKALAAFQQAQGLAASGKLDGDTWQRLAGNGDVPALVDYEISEDDVKGPFTPHIPNRMEDMSQLDQLGYTSPVELLAEKFHVTESLLRDLNRGRALDRAGSAIVVPNVREARGDNAVARVEVDKALKAVRALAADGSLVAFYPASIGSKEKPAPSGTYRIRQVAENPTYHYDPKFQFKGVKAQQRFTIRPGPNNPVGLVWIDLSKPSYGIHGTPDPSKIGKTQSHGCIRLTNWDALDLARRVRKGVQVAFLDR